MIDLGKPLHHIMNEPSSDTVVGNVVSTVFYTIQQHIWTNIWQIVDEHVCVLVIAHLWDIYD